MTSETQVEAPVRITIRPRADGTDYFPIHAGLTEYVRVDVYKDALAALREILQLDYTRAATNGAATRAHRIARAALAAASPETAEQRWTPTAENVNALPEPLRLYVHALESRCDPAGDVRELTIARDMIRALEVERAAQPREEAPGEALRERVAAILVEGIHEAQGQTSKLVWPSDLDRADRIIDLLSERGQEKPGLTYADWFQGDMALSEREEAMYCAECGHEANADHPECPKCGHDCVTNAEGVAALLSQPREGATGEALREEVTWLRQQISGAFGPATMVRFERIIAALLRERDRGGHLGEPAAYEAGFSDGMAEIQLASDLASDGEGDARALALLREVREACLFADDDEGIGVTCDPHISEDLFNRIAALLSERDDRPLCVWCREPVTPKTGAPLMYGGWAHADCSERDGGGDALNTVHCEDCGSHLIVNGPNPIGCPYCSDALITGNIRFDGVMSLDRFAAAALRGSAPPHGDDQWPPERVFIEGWAQGEGSFQQTGVFQMPTEIRAAFARLPIPGSAPPSQREPVDDRVDAWYAVWDLCKELGMRMDMSAEITGLDRVLNFIHRRSAPPVEGTLEDALSPNVTPLTFLRSTNNGADALRRHAYMAEIDGPTHGAELQRNDADVLEKIGYCFAAWNRRNPGRWPRAACTGSAELQICGLCDEPLTEDRPGHYVEYNGYCHDDHTEAQEER